MTDNYSFFSKFYRSPSFSDGELLLRAEQLSSELENLWERLDSLKNCEGCLSEIKQTYQRSKAVAAELGKVIDALEGNGYVCSGFRN
ncbi:hypothetical protein [Photobacterium leiognathi]|uniref:hypothetical protein n=1 Tax=Photobacterium leiognathi TaxID=553611 RepID=UPI002738631A|nr:hypothetical protein [Photobacterium leiognathi]